jgi:acyl carrier protein
MSPDFPAVRDLVAEILTVPADRVEPDTVLGTLGLDSLALVELLLAIESTFAVWLTDEDIDQDLRVGDVLAVITARRGAEG